MKDSEPDQPKGHSAFTPLDGRDPRCIGTPIEQAEDWDSLRGKIRVGDVWRSPSRNYYRHS